MTSHPITATQKLLACIFFVLLTLVCIQPAPAYAQNTPNAANCDELTDPDVKFQMDMCSAHLGCRMVMGIHKTCVKVKGFLTNLKEAIGLGTKGFFGYKKEVTPDSIFEASVSSDLREMDKLPSVIETKKNISKDFYTAAKNELKGSNGTENYIHYGATESGKRKGAGITFFSDGVSERGTFDSNGQLSGSAEVLQSNGDWRYVGDTQQGKRNGNGVVGNKSGEILQARYSNGRVVEGKRTYADGSWYEGTFDKISLPENGKVFRANGTLEAEGRFVGRQLSIGKTYDSSGNVVLEVNLPQDRELAAAKVREADEQRKRNAEVERQAAEQRKKEAAAAAEQASRDSLNAMNPGQLFAKADEQAALGDRAKARETLRLLVSKFPDHPLAATAAQQMAASNTAAAGGANSQTASNAQSTGTSGSTSGSGGSGKPFADCAAAEQRSDLPQKMARIPQNDLTRTLRAAAAASQWMIENYSQCLPDPRAKAQVDQFRKTRQETITTCKQLSSGGNCEVAPW